MKLFSESAKIFTAGLAACAIQTAHAQEWNDPAVFSVNKEPPYAAAIRTYADRNEALKSEESSCETLLDGDWKFKFAENSSAREKEFFRHDFIDSSWGKIRVPSNWEAYGHGSPADKASGKDKDGPVGQFRREFTLPDAPQNGKTFLRFDGVNGALSLWVNGRKVGYSEDGSLPAIFDISQYVRGGRNIIAAEVRNWGDSAAAETAGLWNLSGINGSVSLVSLPDVILRDATIGATLSDNHSNGILSADLLVSNTSNVSRHVKLNGYLLDKSNKLVADANFETVLGAYKGVKCKWEFPEIADVLQWSDEKPELYKLLIEIDTGVKSFAAFNVGFRSVESKNGALLINGKPLVLREVFFDATDPANGTALAKDDLRRDIAALKKLNFNTAVTARPQSKNFYDICDELGVYVAGAPNINSAEKGNTAASDKKWMSAINDRSESFAHFVKNNPSVICWSLNPKIGGNVKTAAEILSQSGGSRPVRVPNNSAPRLKANCLYKNTEPQTEVRDSADPRRKVSVFADTSEKRAIKGAAAIAHPGLFKIPYNGFTVAVKINGDGFAPKAPHDEGSFKASAKKGNAKPAYEEPIIEQADVFSLKFYDDRKILNFAVWNRNAWEVLEVPIKNKRETYQIAASAGDGEMRLYVDGKLVGSKKADISEFYGDSPLVIAAADTGAGRRFGGAVERVAAVSKPITKNFFAKIPEAGIQICDIDFSSFSQRESSGRFFAYGRDFSNNADGVLSFADGLVLPDRTPTPKAFDLRQQNQSIRSKLHEFKNGVASIDIYNDKFFTSLANLSAVWKLTRNGVEIDDGEIRIVPATPQTNYRAFIDLSGNDFTKDGEYALLLTYKIRRGSFGWFGSDEEISHAQFALGGKYADSESEKSYGGVDLRNPFAFESREGDYLRIFNSKFSVEFDSRTGWLRKYSAGGKTLISGPMRLDFWRPPTYEDIASQSDKELVVWKSAGGRALLRSFKTETSDAKFPVKIIASYAIPASGSSAEITYEIWPDGAIAVNAKVSVSAGAPNPPRIGFAFATGDSMNMREWYGLGFSENYADRKDAAILGRHTLKIDDAFFKNILPQDSSNVTEVREAKIFGNGTLTISSRGGKFFELSTYPCLPEDIELAAHPHQIPERNFGTVNIGLKSMGVERGTKEKIQSGKTYSLEFILKGTD